MHARIPPLIERLRVRRRAALATLAVVGALIGAAAETVRVASESTGAPVVPPAVTADAPAQGTPSTPVATPTRSFVAADTAWLPYAALAIRRPTAAPPPRRTPSATAGPTRVRPSATATRTDPPVSPTPSRTAPPSRTATATPTRTPSPSAVPGSATPLACLVEEREPNNAILEALDQPPLCPGPPGSGALPVGDDSDYFRVQLEAPGLIVADLGALPTGTNFDLYVYTRQGQLLGISQLPGTQAEHVEARVTAAGDYYLRVYPQAGRSAEPYSLAWSLQP